MAEQILHFLIIKTKMPLAALMSCVCCCCTVDEAEWDHPLFTVYHDMGRMAPGTDHPWTVGNYTSFILVTKQITLLILVTLGIIIMHRFTSAGYNVLRFVVLK